MLGRDGLVWTEDTLDSFLESPKSLVARTRMSFRGLKDAEDRANLIAYLRAFSKERTPAPELQATGQGIEITLDPSVLAIVGDAEYGEYLSSECLTCHQSNGSNDGIPGNHRLANRRFCYRHACIQTKSQATPRHANDGGASV